MIYYAEKDIETDSFTDIIKNHSVKPAIISGKSETIERIESKFNYFECTVQFFCRLNKTIDLINADTSNVKIAKPNDADRICNLKNVISEFNTNANAENMKKDIANSLIRVYYIENPNTEPISMAQTSAENSCSAMIMSVCTLDEYRKQGFARKIMTKLCYDLQRENKIPCLFYDNPDAGKLYHSMGFETIGMWSRLIF